MVLFNATFQLGKATWSFKLLIAEMLGFVH
jgi:hypothetical protein